MTIKEWAVKELDGHDYEVGSLEAAQYTADNTVKAIGRLLDVLSEDGLLDAKQVARVIFEYTEDDHVELIPEGP